MAAEDLAKQKLQAIAAAKGYTPDAHATEDSVRSRQLCKAKTMRNRETAKRAYNAWADMQTNASELRLRPGLSPPSLPKMKDYLRFYISTSTGKLDEKERPTVVTTESLAKCFFGMFAFETGNTIQDEEREEIYHWARRELPKQGLIVRVRKPKHLFGMTELAHFTKTFWTVDESHFVHPRNKVQVPFLISVYCWTGARIGAFFPDSDEKAKNIAGLRYKDITLVLRRSDVGLQAIYRINQVWVKGNKDPENIVYGASTSSHEKLLYDDTSYLIALAIADGAIFGVESVEDLWECDVPAEGLILPWKEDKKYSPVLRNATMSNGVSEDPLNQSTFSRIVKDALQLSGYFGEPTVHAIRRGLGKRVDNNPDRYTEVERSQHLTQKDKHVFGQSYVANMSSVDGRSAFLNEAPQHGHVELFQSFELYREPGCPSELSAAKEAQLWQRPEIKLLQEAVDQLQGSETSTDKLKEAKRRLKSSYEKIRRKELQKYKMEWVQERRNWKVTSRGKERANDEVKTDLSDILYTIMPELGRLTEAMTADRVVTNEERKQAIQDLCSLASRDCTTLYRPGLQPVNGACPVDSCKKKIIEVDKSQRNTHIKTCRSNEMAQKAVRRPCELRNCDTCFKWVWDEDWETHCQKHLSSLTTRRCARIVYCQTLLRPAFCPFCLGGNGSAPSPSSRWTSWTRDDEMRRHLMKSHLVGIHWPLKCPHPLCDLELRDVTSFIYHLIDIHSMKMSEKQQSELASVCLNGSLQSTSRKRQAQDVVELDLRHAKQARGSSLITPHQPACTSQIPSESSIDEPSITAPVPLPTMSCPALTEMTAIYNVPELTKSEGTSPANSPEVSLMDDLSSHGLRPQTPLCYSVDDLSSQDLRVHTPLCDSVQGNPIEDYISQRNSNNAIVISPTVDPSKLVLHKEAEMLPVALVSHDDVEQQESLVQRLSVKQSESRIKLRLSQPKPKPKIKLRLCPPKYDPGPTRTRRGHGHTAKRLIRAI